jgi:hypothetical protein
LRRAAGHHSAHDGRLLELECCRAGEGAEKRVDRLTALVACLFGLGGLIKAIFLAASRASTSVGLSVAILQIMPHSLEYGRVQLRASGGGATDWSPIRTPLPPAMKVIELFRPVARSQHRARHRARPLFYG